MIDVLDVLNDFFFCFSKMLFVLQVYYRFNKLSMLREPFMLISGFFILFVSCIVYMHVDLSISKSSASYLAKLQWDEVRRMSYHVLFQFRLTSLFTTEKTNIYYNINSYMISGASNNSASHKYYQPMPI